MPKNRHARTGDSTKNQAQNATGAPIGPVRFSVALLAGLVGVGATGVLSYQSLGIGAVFGCGEGGGCDKAADSVFGSVPGLGWPVSFLGFAFFVAMLAALFMHRRGVTPVFKAMAALGALSSAFYMVVILLNLDDYVCPWCITSHLANFLFAGAILTAGRPARSLAPLPSVATAGAAFVGAMALTLGAGAWATSYNEAKAEAEANDTVDRIAKANQDSANTVATTVTPATTDTGGQQQQLPQGWLEGFDREVAFPSEHLPRDAYRTDDRGFTGHYRLGPKDAPIRIVVFSCYECKFCATLEKEVFDILEARDDVSFTHKHFPLNEDCNPAAANARSQHQNGCTASYIVEAVGLLYGPEAFWRLHAFLFEAIRQQERFNIRDVLNGFGMDAQRVLELAETSPQVRERVREDVQLGADLGLRQTPFVFINGVEVRGLNAVGALTRIVNRAARTAQPNTPENDTPPGAIQKFVDDYFNTRGRNAELGKDLAPNGVGPEGAPVEVQVWFGFKTPVAGLTLSAFQSVQAKYPNAVRLTYRHYPMGEECNFFSNASDFPGSCEMHYALEGAGVIGGNQAFNDALAWLIDNESRFTPETAEIMRREMAQAIGIDPEKLEEMITSETSMTVSQLNAASLDEKLITESLLVDAQYLDSLKRRAVIPIVFVNGRRIAKYAFRGDLTSVLEGVVRGELGLDDEENAGG